MVAHAPPRTESIASGQLPVAREAAGQLPLFDGPLPGLGRDHPIERELIDLLYHLVEVVQCHEHEIGRMQDRLRNVEQGIVDFLRVGAKL